MCLKIWHKCKGIKFGQTKVSDLLSRIRQTRSNCLIRVLGQAQERNAYALNVLRRVRAKLDGREYSEQHRMSVPEQVGKPHISFLIPHGLYVDHFRSILYLRKLRRLTIYVPCMKDGWDGYNCLL